MTNVITAGEVRQATTRAIDGRTLGLITDIRAVRGSLSSTATTLTTTAGPTTTYQWITSQHECDRGTSTAITLTTSTGSTTTYQRTIPQHEGDRGTSVATTQNDRTRVCTRRRRPDRTGRLRRTTRGLVLVAVVALLRTTRGLQAVIKTPANLNRLADKPKDGPVEQAPCRLAWKRAVGTRNTLRLAKRGTIIALVIEMATDAVW